MAARSPPSPPPARLSGTRSSRVGRGAAVHAVSSEASGLGGAAREGVVDRGDLSWPGGEGSGGQRGPGGSAPAQAPLLSAPPGSERLEGISVEEVMVARMQLLEEELSSLKEELALCQVSRPPLRAGALGRRDPLPPPWAARPRGLESHPAPPRPRRSLPAPTRSPGRLPAARPRAPAPPWTPAELSSRVPGFGCLHMDTAWTGRRTLPAPPPQAPSPRGQRSWVPQARRAGHEVKC